MEQYMTASEILPSEAQIDLADLSSGWQPSLTIGGLGCTHTVYVDDAYTTAIRVSQPDGMPGPQAYAKWKSAPVTAHVYRFAEGNEMESQMAFDRWVVEFAHNSVRRECGYGPDVTD